MSNLLISHCDLGSDRGYGGFKPTIDHSPSPLIEGQLPNSWEL